MIEYITLKNYFIYSGYFMMVKIKLSLNYYELVVD